MGILSSIGGGIARFAVGTVAPWAAAIPARAWMIIAGVAVVLVAVMFWNSHERAIGEKRGQDAITALNKVLGEKQTQLDAAQDANHACDGTITRLELDKATCESGRTLDQAQQAKTIAERNATEVNLKRDAAASRAKLQATLAGRCKAWADQPTCEGAP